MKSACLLAVALFVMACAHSALASDGQLPARFRADGFVFCSDPAKDQPVPVYVRICNKRQIATLNCGEKVQVLSRLNDMLTIASSERPPRRFVPASAISRQPDKFVPFDDQSGIPEGRAPDCAQLLARENAPEGFVFCSDPQASASVYLNACQSNALSTVACGEKVRVLTRRGDRLQVSLPPNALPRFMAASVVSQQAGKFVPFDDDSGVPDKGSPDCPVRPDRNVTPPRAIYSPPPPFTEQARKKKVQGVVVLSLTVGVDGTARDVTVDHGLGYGLDENAMETVSRWKFEPARKDGEPIEKRISVEVSFRLY